MIERKCETCDIDHGRCISRCLCNDCQAPDRPKHIPSRAALEAEVERLEACLRGAEDATDAAREERDAAISRASEERAARCGLEEQLAESERQRDELRAQAEDWAAQYRALSASVESERAGLRHSLAEVESERDEAVNAMEEWRARAEVAEPERDRLREELGAMLAVIDGNRSCHYGLEANSKFRESVARLRALLGEAKGGGGA